MIPIPVRLAMIGLGILLLGGSWLIGNSVDAGLTYGKMKPDPLAKDALTFSARIVGAFLIVLGLLIWVVSQARPDGTL
jgi:hypothetical protein